MPLPAAFGSCITTPLSMKSPGAVPPLRGSAAFGRRESILHNEMQLSNSKGAWQFLKRSHPQRCEINTSLCLCFYRWVLRSLQERIDPMHQGSAPNGPTNVLPNYKGFPALSIQQGSSGLGCEEY